MVDNQQNKIYNPFCRNYREDYFIMKTKNMVLCGLMAAILCILAPIVVPLPGNLVPLSLTNFVLYITAFVLDWKYGTISYLVYLLLGIVGLPVFSGYGSGPAKVAGPTGGYLVGFIFITLICGYVNKKFNGKIHMYIVGMIIGLAMNYLFGTVWFSYQQNMSIKASLVLCVVPFLIGDAIKIIAAAIIGPVIKKAVGHINN